jgi:uncharacterized protein YbjT (DUF2867 family)
MRVCIVGASGKLGRYMVRHALDRGHEVVAVCREQSIGKLDAFKRQISVVPGATNDPEVIRRAVAGCDGVLVVLVPRGVHGYATGTAQAVLDHAPPGAPRLLVRLAHHPRRPGRVPVEAELAGPRTDSADSLDGDAHHLARWRVVHRREPDAGPEVDVGEPL